MAGGERSVLDLLNELGAALNVNYGELSVRYEASRPVLLRHSGTLKTDVLELMPAEPGSGRGLAEVAGHG